MTRYWLIVTRVFLLVALATSSVLYSYYLDPVDSQFCAAQSGCETLRRSPLAYFFSTPYVSLPLFGMIAFAGAFFTSFWVARRSAAQRFRPLLWMLAAGALLALGLVGYQAWVARAYCWLCLIADGAAVLAAASAFRLDRTSTVSHGATQAPGVESWAWFALAALAIAAPLTWNAVRPLPPVPEPIRALYRPGVINVVEFADMQCPHCRKLHPMLKRVMESHPGNVNFVRKHAPLPMHHLAEGAARGVICADQLAEQGEAMVDRLVASELEEQSVDDAARELGLDRAAFLACLRDPATQARIEADLALLTAVGFDGLPTTYVGGQRFIGARNEEAWRDAFDRAQQGDDASGVPAPLFMVGLLLLVAGLVGKGRITQG